MGNRKTKQPKPPKWIFVSSEHYYSEYPWNAETRIVPCARFSRRCLPFAIIVLLGRLGRDGLLGSLLRLLRLGGLGLGALVTRVVERSKEVSGRLKNTG